MIHTAKDAYKWQWREGATEEVCNEYGWQSQECQQFVDIYNNQFAVSKMAKTSGVISSTVFGLIIFFAVILWIAPKIIGLYAKKQ